MLRNADDKLNAVIAAALCAFRERTPGLWPSARLIIANMCVQNLAAKERT